MADINSILEKGITNIMGLGGLSTTVNIYSYTFIESDYDDQKIQTLTGSNTISGLVFPIKSAQGSTEAMLLQQGKLLTNDQVLFIGSCNFSGNIIVELQNNFYTVIPDGIQTWSVNGSHIYSKVYLRRNLGGSIL